MKTIVSSSKQSEWMSTNINPMSHKAYLFLVVVTMSLSAIGISFSQEGIIPQHPSNEEVLKARDQMDARIKSMPQVPGTDAETKRIAGLIMNINSKAIAEKLHANDNELTELQTSISQTKSNEAKAGWLMNLDVSSETLPLYLDSLSSLPSNLFGKVVSRLPVRLRKLDSADENRLIDYIQSKANTFFESKSESSLRSCCMGLVKINSSKSINVLSDIIIKSEMNRAGAGVSLLRHIKAGNKGKCDLLLNEIKKSNPDIMGKITEAINNIPINKQ